MIDSKRTHPVRLPDESELKKAWFYLGFIIRAQFCPTTCVTFLSIWRNGQQLSADGQSDFELDYPDKLERQILGAAADRIESILDLEDDE
jgi:hypothetical protein